MKRIILSLVLFVSLGAVFAQEYNPYRYEEWKKTQNQASAREREEFLAKKCDGVSLQSLIKNYDATKNIEVLEKIRYNYNCPEIINLSVELITTSLDEEARKIAIQMLGSMMHYDAIPLLLDHVEKEISSDEKILIAFTLAILDRKKEALKILECNCYEMDDIDNTCSHAYSFLFDKSVALKYFEYYFEKSQAQMEAASMLATLGVYDKTFPLFVEFLKNNTTYKRGTVYSLTGLAAIGTDEALEIIEYYAENGKGLISRTAEQVLDRMKKEGRGK